jgi:hypothetical protein
MESATGIVPEELMYPTKTAEVMKFLQDAPIKGHRKREIFFAWSRAVGVKLTGSQYNAVYLSGIDMPSPAPRGELAPGS